MIKIKKLISKTWIFVSAALIIAGSSTAMASALNNSIPENVSDNVAPYTTASVVNNQIQSPNFEAVAGYTVVDLSRQGLDAEKKDALRKKLSYIKDITPEEIEEKYNTIIANTIPGEKDMTAKQAAAYGADILNRIYGMDLDGYTAEASFSRNSVPNSDSWTIIFHASQEAQDSRRYIASVNSVSGTMLDAGSYTREYVEEDSSDLNNPQWKNKAMGIVSKLMPENASITNSRVVLATSATGFTIVCELSDGSAYAVRLAGSDKEAAACIFFPDGYDGSLDVKAVTGNGVG